MTIERILPIALDLAGRPEGMSNGELAKAASITASAAGAYIQAYLQRGHLHKSTKPEGARARYFTTRAAAIQHVAPHASAGESTARDPETVARDAVFMLKHQQRNSVELAQATSVGSGYLDACLAPLVATHKLVRVDVIRDGIAMFDYRMSAVWTPKDDDFAVCRAPLTRAPKPVVSAIAPPKAASAPSPSPRPASLSDPRPAPVQPANPWVKLGARTKDALAAGADLGRRVAPAEEATPPEASIAPPAAPTAAASKAPTLDSATLDAVLDHSRAPNILEADDLVCAINSRGELAIDLGDSNLIKFPPARALYLKRFLDNTSVLEELAATGLI